MVLIRELKKSNLSLIKQTTEIKKGLILLRDLRKIRFLTAFFLNSALCLYSKRHQENHFVMCV